MWQSRVSSGVCLGMAGGVVPEVCVGGSLEPPVVRVAGCGVSWSCVWVSGGVMVCLSPAAVACVVARA